MPVYSVGWKANLLFFTDNQRTWIRHLTSNAEEASVRGPIDASASSNFEDTFRTPSDAMTAEEHRYLTILLEGDAANGGGVDEDSQVADNEKARR